MSKSALFVFAFFFRSDFLRHYAIAPVDATVSAPIKPLSRAPY